MNKVTTTLKRGECAILSLVLSKRWFDMVATGQKKEEYRDLNDYWLKRIGNWRRKAEYSGTELVVEFRLGRFGRAQRTAFLLDGLFIRDANRFMHPDWGEPQGAHYVILLGKRVRLVDDVPAVPAVPAPFNLSTFQPFNLDP